MWAAEPGTHTKSTLPVDGRPARDRINVIGFALFLRFRMMDALLDALGSRGEEQYEAILAHSDKDDDRDDDWFTTRAATKLMWTGPWDSVPRVAEYLWNVPNLALFISCGEGSKKSARNVEGGIARVQARGSDLRLDARVQEEGNPEDSDKFFGGSGKYHTCPPGVDKDKKR